MSKIATHSPDNKIFHKQHNAPSETIKLLILFESFLNLTKQHAQPLLDLNKNDSFLCLF